MMDKSALALLKECIVERWYPHAYLGLLKSKMPGCALCKEYTFLVHEKNCEKCPVCIAVGEPECENTPYYDWLDSYNKEQHTLAVIETEFLLSLMPNGETVTTSDGKTHSNKGIGNG